MTYRLPNRKNTRGVKVESKYMTLEEYAATLKVGDEVTIEYYSISGDRQTKEKNFKNNQKRNYLCKKYRLQERHKI